MSRRPTRAAIVAAFAAGNVHVVRGLAGDRLTLDVDPHPPSWRSGMLGR